MTGVELAAAAAAAGAAASGAGAAGAGAAAAGTAAALGGTAAAGAGTAAGLGAAGAGTAAGLGAAGAGTATAAMLAPEIAAMGTWGAGAGMTGAGLGAGLGAAEAAAPALAMLPEAATAGAAEAGSAPSIAAMGTWEPGPFGGSAGVGTWGEAGASQVPALDLTATSPSGLSGQAPASSDILRSGPQAYEAVSQPGPSYADAYPTSWYDKAFDVMGDNPLGKIQQGMAIGNAVKSLTGGGQRAPAPQLSAPRSSPYGGPTANDAMKQLAQIIAARRRRLG